MDKEKKIEELNKLLDELDCKPEIKDKVKELLYEILEKTYNNK